MLLLPPCDTLQTLQNLASTHVNSFNFLLNHGIDLAVQNLEAVSVVVQGMTVVLSITHCAVGLPTPTNVNVAALKPQLYPSECRQRRVTYKSPITLTFQVV